MLEHVTYKTAHRGQLYYQEFKYSIRFVFKHLNVIRGLPAVNKIKQIAGFRSQYLKRQIEQPTVQQLIEISEFLSNYKYQSKFVVSGSWGYLYINDTAVAAKMYNDLPFVDVVSITEVTASAQPNVLALKSPRYKHRTYFKSKKLTPQQWNTLSDFLKHRPDIRLGPGFEKCLYDMANTNAWPYLYNSFFVDYNDAGELLFLNMAVPGITGRTLNIVAK